MGSVSRGKNPIRGHSRGAATHNGAAEPGQLEVTIWGVADKEPDRKIAVVLDEEAVRHLVMRLGGYGFYAGRRAEHD
jgi:hypothetical protein